jgi:hypothetical protein
MYNAEDQVQGGYANWSRIIMADDMNALTLFSRPA